MSRVNRCFYADNRPAEPGQLPFAMSSDVPSEVSIPSVFCLQTDGDLLWSYVVENEVVRVRLSGDAKGCLPV